MNAKPLKRIAALRRSFVALALSLAWLAQPAAAADVPKAIDPSKVTSAGEIPKPGDNFQFRQPLKIFHEYDPSAPAQPAAQVFCADTDSWAKILNVPTATDPNYYVIFPSERWYEWSVTRGGIPGLSPSIRSPGDKEAADKKALAAKTKIASCPVGETVTNDVTYKFDKGVLDKIDVSRFGPTYGALIVPFKFHFSDHKIDASSAVLGYFGYEGWLTGASSAIFLAAGMSAVNIPTTDASGTATNQTKAALTAAVGVNWTFGTTSLWKGGVLVGWDWAGKNVGYDQYEHKPWLSVSLGIGF